MKIQAARIDSYIEGQLKSTRGVLVYGSDPGMVEERAGHIVGKIIGAKNDPFRLVDISAEQLKKEPSILLDEIKTPTFGGGKKLVRIRDDSALSAPVLKRLMDESANFTDQDAFVLVVGGELGPTSAIRRSFEYSKTMAAIACYAEDKRELAAFIARKFKEQHKGFDVDIPMLIADASLGNRSVAMMELTKVQLCTHDEEYIHLEDALKLLGDTAEASLDDLICAVLEGNPAIAKKQLLRAMHSGIEPIAIFRTFYRYIDRLGQALSEMDSGNSADQAIEMLKPPIFFKQAPTFKRHLQRFFKYRKELFAIQCELYRAERELKQGLIKPELLVSEALFKLLLHLKNAQKQVSPVF